MSFPARGDDVLNDMIPNSVCSQNSGLQYRSSTMPTSFEPVPVTDDLCETILSALGRDSDLRRAYVRRRWQGRTC